MEHSELPAPETLVKVQAELVLWGVGPSICRAFTAPLKARWLSLCWKDVSDTVITRVTVDSAASHAEWFGSGSQHGEHGGVSCS